MNINIKATNLEITPAIEDYMNKKVESIAKFLKQAENPIINIELGKNSNHHKTGDIFKAEIHIKTAGDEFYAKVDKDDLYSAMDEVKDELVREINSKRKKALRLFRKGGQKIKNIIKNFGF